MRYFYIWFEGQTQSGELYAMCRTDMECESLFRQWYDGKERIFGDLLNYGVEETEPGRYYFQAKAHPDSILM